MKNKKKSEFPKIVRDRKNGGYKIKFEDGSLSPENYSYKVGAQAAIDGNSESQWECGLRDCLLEGINP